MIDPEIIFRKWPFLPPWWMVNAPAAADILAMRPAALRPPKGPPSVPPMYLKTAGTWFRYGTLRNWYVEGLGLGWAYPLENQVNDFLDSAAPAVSGRGDAIPYFEALLEADRAALVAAKEPRWLDPHLVHELDRWRQPVLINDSITQKPDFWAA